MKNTFYYRGNVLEWKAVELETIDPVASALSLLGTRPYQGDEVVTRVTVACDLGVFEARRGWKE